MGGKTMGEMRKIHEETENALASHARKIGKMEASRATLV